MITMDKLIEYLNAAKNTIFLNGIMRDYEGFRQLT